MTRHNCEEWIADGWGCANCNATAGAVRHYWNDPVREERDELRLQVKSLTARLAAQSGYAEDEELATLREDKARLDWLDKQFEEFEAWSEIWVRESKSADLRKVIDEMREAK